MALFTASSVACGVSDSQALLIAGRFAQGIGGALSSSVTIAIVVTEFPEARERAKAMSAYIFVAVGGGSIGLLVGGVLTQALNWHWIFFINVPIGVVTFVFGRILIEENDGPGLRAGLDVLGVNPGHGGVDGRHLCHHPGDRLRLGFGPHARTRRRGGASPLLSSWPWRPDWRTRSCRCVFCASGP